MMWWAFWITAVATVVTLAVADLRDLQALRFIQGSRPELNRILRERKLEWATLIFFALLSSPALLLVIREVSGILGE